jgi:uncharacterized protein
MKELRETFISSIDKVSLDFQRYLIDEIPWLDRMIAVKGARGTGKTTMLLQYIKQNIPINDEVIYVSLDDLYFSENRLVNFASDFVKSGGKFLFLDEVHKYPTWSRELKNIYDNHTDLKIIVTASSALELYKGDADLSRRLLSFDLHGLSFREFIEFTLGIRFDILSLKDILKDHLDIAREINKKIKPIAEFNKYLKYGYYPYFKENIETYPMKLANTMNVVLENDLPIIEGIEYFNVTKLKKLLYIIARSVPFKPNITKLAEALELSRQTVIQYMNYLQKAHIVNLLHSDPNNVGYLTKPEKIYLNNTNIIHALMPKNFETGTVRESFFYNQLNVRHKIIMAKKADFVVDDNLTFEIGGKNKSQDQIKGTKNAFIAADNIEYGFKNMIPLWMFGFLY